MARAGVWSSIVEGARKDGGLSVFSAIMAILCAVVALVLAAWLTFLIYNCAAGCVKFWFFDPRHLESNMHWDLNSYKISNTVCTQIDNLHKRCVTNIRYDYNAAQADFNKMKTDVIWAFFPGLFFVVVPDIIFIYGLVGAVICFKCFCSRQFFSKRVARKLRAFAFCGLLFVLVAPHSGWMAKQFGHFVATWAAAIRSHGNNKVTEAINLDFETIFKTFGETVVYDVCTVLYALTLAIIAAVMAKAAAIAEDNASIV